MRHFARVAVRNEAGQYLLLHTIKKGRNRYELPGGKLDEGETAAIAASRELTEETGLIPTVPLVSVIKIGNLRIDEEYWYGHFYFASEVRGEATVKEPTKADVLGWFNIEQIKYLPTIPILSLEVCLEVEKLLQNRPKIVCLCGSTKFYKAFQEANYHETSAGRIVLSVGFFMHSPEGNHNQNVGCTPEEKIKLDILHKKKIDLADEVYVLNVGGYIGDSTRSEINYAFHHHKKIRYLETPTHGCPHCAYQHPPDGVCV